MRVCALGRGSSPHHSVRHERLDVHLEEFGVGQVLRVVARRCVAAARRERGRRKPELDGRAAHRAQHEADGDAAAELLVERLARVPADWLLLLFWLFCIF